MRFLGPRPRNDKGVAQDDRKVPNRVTLEQNASSSADIAARVWLVDIIRQVGAGQQTGAGLLPRQFTSPAQPGYSYTGVAIPLSSFTLAISAARRSQ